MNTDFLQISILVTFPFIIIIGVVTAKNRKDYLRLICAVASLFVALGVGINIKETYKADVQAVVQADIESTTYDDLDSHKLSDDVAIDVITNDATHKQIFVYGKRYGLNYQLIATKNNDNSVTIRPFVKPSYNDA